MDDSVFTGSVFTGSVYRAANECEALKMFNANILPTLENRQTSRIDGLRRRIMEGKSWMYVVYETGFESYYYMNLYPSEQFGDYGFGCLQSCRNLSTGQFDPNVENPGFLEHRTWHGDEEWHPSCYENFCNLLPRIRQGEGVEGFNETDIVAVVDIVDVQLVSVKGYDFARRHPRFLTECRAVYHILADIRKIEKGTLRSRGVIIEKECSREDFVYPGAWLYYRGMSLRIGLKKNGKNLSLAKQDPVLPYEPFSGEQVEVRGGNLTPIDSVDELDNRKLTPLTVEYGHHTKIEYLHGDIVCRGTDATFFDFGVSSRIRILELKSASDKDYWENAWFISEISSPTSR